MMALLNAEALVGLVALVILVIGGGMVACSGCGRALVGLELLAYSVGFGILGLAIIGIGVVSITADYARNAWVLGLIAIVFSGIQWYRYGTLSRLFGLRASTSATQTRLAAVGWVLMAAIPMMITFLPVRMPADLPDGAYVIKNDHVHVRVQVMMGAFPADNYIPFVATEYLLRDIPFAEERPLMPGQELANRPILMSLAAVPLGALLDEPLKYNGPQPTFRYVGRQWPDVGRYGDDASYRRFLAVALVLNASLFVGAALLFHHFGLRPAYWVAGLLVIGSSPYFIGQTLFSWPKSLAAFFLLLSAFTLLARQRTWVAGLFAALAYWSHPYALPFIGAFALYLLIREVNDLEPRRGLLPFLVTASAGPIVWWIWSQWYLQLPSDLVEQNVASGGGLVAQAGTRFINLINAFAPISFTTWPSLSDLVQASLLGMVGGIGLLLLPQAILASGQCVLARSKEFLLLVVLPSSLLIGVFSALAVPAVHGLQVIAVILLMLSLRWMQQRKLDALMLFCVAAQLTINIALLIYRGHALMHG